MSNSKKFWDYMVADLVKMSYEELPGVIREASGLSDTDLIAALTKRRMDSDSHAEIFTCSRILSALIGGPDLLE